MPDLLHSALLVLLSVCISAGAAGETNITAEPGQNITLRCIAPENKPFVIIDWSRTDLGEKDHVALYQDERLDYHGQHPAYKNRVEMKDRELKDGDVSLFLKNVTINDTGIYECRIDEQKKRWKRAHLETDPICTINLLVAPPPTGNRGDQKGIRDEEEEDKDDGGNKSGLIVGVSVGVPVGVLFALGLVVGGVLLYKYRRRMDREQNPPPAEGTELQPMNPGDHPPAES